MLPSVWARPPGAHTLCRRCAGTNNTWYGVGLGNEFITIPPTDPNYAPAPSTYYISVFGWGANSTFSLTAVELTNPSAVYLLDGQPQAGLTSAAHTFSYFIFNVTTDGNAIADLDVFASPLSGDVDLYISNRVTIDVRTGNVVPVYPQVNCARPLVPTGCALWVVDNTTFTWSSTYSGIPDFVTIAKAFLQPGQQLIVGVLASTPDAPGNPAPASSFSVTAVSATNMVDLQDGVAVMGTVAPSAYKYYSFVTTSFGSDVIITGVTLRGAIDVFVSETNTHPARGASTWNTTSNGGGIQRNDVVYIPFSTLSVACR